MTQVATTEHWNNFIVDLKNSVGNDEIEAWVNHLVFIDFNPKKLTIGGLNRFFCDWIRDKHREKVRNLLLQSFKTLHLDDDFDLILTNDNTPASSPALTTSTQSDQQEGAFQSGLDSRNRFEYFVNGSNSNIAYAAARAVGDNYKDTKYNPLFLCGGVGLGKTHLMQAIGIHIQETNPSVKVLYTSSEQFTNDVINGIRFNQMNQIRDKYRSLDLLLIDDIHFLENKASTQEEFFHTFNALIQDQKQVVLTSDRYPKEITNIQERLTSRFSAGMVTRIEPPDIETRVAIIRNELDRNHFPLPNDIVDFLASSIKSNVRDIKGVLIRLEAEWSLMGKDVSLETTRLILKEILHLDNSPISIEDIIKAVCTKYNVKISDIKSDKRDREISTARQIAMYISRELTDHSFPAIGKQFGGKNHTSVLQACKKTKQLMIDDPEAKQTIDSLIRELSIQ